MELFSKITFFSCIPAKLVVVSFPKASAKLQGLFQTTKFFGRKFSENFSARSAKTFHAPYSQRVKAHKKFFARRALFCSYKGAGPASLSGRKRKSRPFIAIRQIFQTVFYTFMPLNIKKKTFDTLSWGHFFASYPPHCSIIRKRLVQTRRLGKFFPRLGVCFPSRRVFIPRLPIPKTKRNAIFQSVIFLKALYPFQKLHKKV